MEWIKIPIDSILLSEFKNSELLALIKYQAIHCQLETEPTKAQLCRILNQKEMKFVSSYSGVTHELIQNQIKKVKHKRNNDKLNYTKKQGVVNNSAREQSADSALSVSTEEIRRDEKRIDKKKDKTEKFILSCDALYQEPLRIWLKYRSDLKKEEQWLFQYKQLQKLSKPMDSVIQSRGNGWKGLFERKEVKQDSDKRINWDEVLKDD